MREAYKIEQEGKESGKKRPPLRSRLWAWTGFADKTLWEWLQLLGALAIPVVLAIAGFWFTSQQEERQQRIEDQRAQQAQKIENQRAEAERELAEQRAQDEALQAYLDQMSGLLLERDLRASEADSEVRSLARARTLTVLSRLDPSRKTALMQFLVEADLVQRVDGRGPIISLRDANLSGALLIMVDLSGADLRFANLSDANLSDANLSDADLSGALLWQTDLSGADLNNALLWGTDLPNADLSDAYLKDADLNNADLPNADLSDAFLRRAILYDATLSKTNLSGADLKDADLLRADLSGADLPNADLSGADLSDADLLRAELSRTDLPNADLSGADLSDANLSGADLSAVDLTGADGVSKEILKQQAKSLRAATMPDGTVFPHRYVTEEFEPAFHFEADEDWAFGSPETPDQVWIQRGTEGGQLLFTNPSDVLDPSNLSEPKKLPEPENAEEWVSWLQRHPNVETSKPVSVSVGGASGMRINVTASSTPENYPWEFCGQQPCVPLYPLSDGNGVISFEGFKDGFVIVDVGNETVLIDVAARADKFDEFLPKAQKVLESVEWKGG